MLGARMLMGEVAALGTATCWSFTSLFFAAAARRIGSLRLNLLRLPIACVLLSVVLAATASPLAGITPLRLFYLASSAVIGLVLGDLAYFGGLRRLGPRLTSLLMSTAPIFATAFGLLLLAELPSPRALLGIAVTLAGVAWVTAETRPALGQGRPHPGGVLLGLAGGACQGVGLVLAKLGMAGEVAPLAATWVRIGVATVVIWALSALAGRTPTALGLGHALRGAWRFVFGGAFFGPFLGVWLSLVAARYTDVGIAATLMATSPILVIPLVMAAESYRPSLRAVAGTVAAVAGVALLLLSH
jgi:drug/metabolite transporter (DMT)-like permease